MRNALLCLAALSMTACAPLSTGVTSTITISADKGIVVAQAGFKSMQQSVLAAIQSGLLTGSAKAKAIDLVNQGQLIENRIYTTRNAADVTLLIGIVSQLSALGIKGN